MVLDDTSKTRSQMMDLDTMDVLFEPDRAFTQSGCLAEDGSGAYLFATLDDFDGIGYFDFETQACTPVYGNGSIVNFQMMR